MGDSLETEAANAHLCAASPELYAALKGMIGDGGDDGLSNFGDSARSRVEWISKARAALAKARGETT